MSKKVVTARIDEGVLAALDGLAKGVRRTRASLVEQAVEAYVEEQAAFVAEGDRDIRDGRFLTGDEICWSVPTSSTTSPPRWTFSPISRGWVLRSRRAGCGGGGSAGRPT